LRGEREKADATGKGTPAKEEPTPTDEAVFLLHWSVTAPWWGDCVLELVILECPPYPE